jgi:hypothetical protein
MPRNYFKSGDWNAICDRCGFKFKGSQLKEEWNGWMTCSSCWEIKHPSLMQRVPTETSMPNFTRPEAVDQFVSVPPPPGPPAPAPGLIMPDYVEPLVRHPVDWLQIGDYVWMDGRWGFASLNPGVDPDLTEGPNDYNFMQLIGRCTTLADDNSCAGRWQIRWPFVNSVGHTIAGNTNYSEVKAYPSVLYGKKPGFLGSSMWPAFSVVNRKSDNGVEPVPNPSYTPGNIAGDWQPQGGTVDQTFPSGGTPGTGTSVMPLLLPLTGKTCKIRFKYKEYAPPTGSGHLSFDIFLTQTSAQLQGFAQSSITHEIMIPIRYWGTPGYGSYPNRNPAWYDHDVTIDGVLYHVYCAKRLNRNDATGVFDTNGGVGYYPGLRYNFGGLDPVHNFINEETGVARLGWKFIVFEPDTDHHQVDGNGFVNLDISKFLAHLAATTDERGTAFIRNTEYLQSIELGIEPVVGTADIAPYFYKVLASNSVVAMPPEPPNFVPPPPPPPPSPPPPPPPPPPAPPPSADTTIQAFFTAGKVGWWGKVTTLSDFVEDEAVGTAPADFTKLVGRWKNHGNVTDGHDMIQTNNTFRCQLGTDAGGVGAHYVSWLYWSTDARHWRRNDRLLRLLCGEYSNSVL